MAYQYYYQKYQWLDYWDTINSGGVVASRIMHSSTSTESASVGTEFFVPDPENYYDSYGTRVDSTIGGYSDYVFIANGYSLYDNRSTAQYGDIYYRKSGDKMVKYRITLVQTDIAGQKSFWLTKIAELSLQQYTIYHHQLKGTLLTTVVADDGTYPDEGLQGGFYWVKTTKPQVAVSPIADKTVAENVLLDFVVSAAIDGTSVIVLNAQNLPAGAAFDSATGRFSWTPSYIQQGEYLVTFTADANGTTASKGVRINVIDVIRWPAINPIEGIEVAEGEPVEVILGITNLDNLELVLSAVNLPAGAVFDTETGVFAWTPSYSQAGDYAVTFIAAYQGGSTQQLCRIKVIDVVPSLDAIGDKRVHENENLAFKVSANAPETATVILSAIDLPDGAVFDTGTGVFSWTPTFYQSGVYHVTFVARINDTEISSTISIRVVGVIRELIRIAPVPNYETGDRRPYFTFEVQPNDLPDSNKYHARLRVSTASDMSNTVMITESRVDQSNWELWDDNQSQWVAFPGDGVSAGSRIRVRPIESLGFGFFYWDCATFSAVPIGYGLDGDARKLHILLSTSKPYMLLISGVEYNAYSLVVAETSNGEIGTIHFEISNIGGLAFGAIDYGAEVLLVINDLLGNQEQFKGVIKIKQPLGSALSVVAVTGDGLLAERRVKEDYPEQDIGLTVKQIIDTYCSPLTSINVDTNTGFTAPVKARDKTPIRVFEDLRRRYGPMYYVSEAWDMHLDKQSAVQDALITVRYGGGV